MKRISLILICVFAFIACKKEKEGTQQVQKESITYASFGEKISEDNVVSKELAAEKFSNLKEGDTINLKFASTINEVCKKKGCWMKLDLGDQQESMVRFKDYGFFVPLDADAKEVIVAGRAFVKKVPVEELQHYAKDSGKSEEEIAAIVAPEFTYAFEASGVLLKE